MSGSYTRDFKPTVLDAEHERIAAIRQTRRKIGIGAQPDDAPYTGLALSGGGIRSAAFGLGVLHALQKHGILQRIDYLSTVSGGGYIGSTLTYLEALRARPDIPNDVKTKLELGTRAVGAKTEDRAKNAFLDHIRGHGNYISQGDRLGIGSAIAMMLRSIMIGLFIWLPLAALGLALICLPIDLVQLATSWDDKLGIGALLIDRHKHTFGDELVWLFVPAALALLVMLVGSVWCGARSGPRSAEEHYNARLSHQRRLGNLLKFAGGLAVLASLPYAVEHLLANASDGATLQALVASGTSVVGGVMAFLGFFGMNRREAGGVDVTGLLAAAGAALMLYGGLLLALLMAHHAVVLSHWAIGSSPRVLAESLAFASFVGVGFLAILAAISIWVARRTDLNVVALHRLYRDRLMETFLPNRETVGKWCKATDAEHFWLADASPDYGTGPYHLINANAVLIHSSNTRYAGRGGDSFVLSPLWCGSNATGWCRTKDSIRFESHDPDRPDRLSLATAMAISGAAVNPNAGSSGRGPMRNRFVAFAMSLLNLRLACWLPNPDPKTAPRKRTTDDGVEYSASPNWWSPGRQILLGRAHREENPFIEVSDGGHFENLGIYELVRRRTRVIIVAGGSADPSFGFEYLGNALERCRVDFGVDIRFSDKKLDLRHLLPLADGETVFDKSFPLARRGVAVAEIRYPPDADHAAEVGRMIYLKTATCRPTFMPTSWPTRPFRTRAPGISGSTRRSSRLIASWATAS